MLGRVAVIVVWLLAGCLQSDLVICGDGRACPIGTVCDDAHRGCASPDQLAACLSAIDGDRCEASVPGLCDQGVCLPGCGDAVQSANEQCDDGNVANHDGCSSSCEIETLQWSPWNDPEPWTPRVNHVTAYDEARDHLFVFGGASPEGVDGTAWQRTYAFFVSDEWQRVPALPSARMYAAMAFDATRQVTVLFGGIDGLPSIGTVLGDTWEYDGTTWIKRSPVVSPPIRFASAMVYDPVRGVVVMFGGVNADGNYLGDTWEYNGTTWAPRSSTLSPSPRGHHALAWDADRGVAVTFGRERGTCDTWELSATGWTPVTTPTMPDCRTDTAMAFLPSRHAVVLFGGSLGFFSPAPASDTWEYDATGWHPILAGASTPPGRTGHTLTFDSTANAVVLVGGSADSLFEDVWQYETDGAWHLQSPTFGSPGPGVAAVFYDPSRHETVALHTVQIPWSFDGIRWHELPRSGAEPDPRILPGFAFDPTRGLVMCGGEIGAGALDDCWAWRDQWTELAISPRPPARAVPALAYSEKDGALVLFGGGDLASSSLLYGDTWELTGNTWRQIDGLSHPDPQRGAAMAYDPARERLVLFALDASTWTYANHAWSKLSTLHSPPPRAIASFIHDPRRQTLVLIGGAIDERIATDDVWELDGEDWHPLQVANRPPPRLITGLAYDVPSRSIVMFGGATGTAVLGDTWLLRYTSTTPDEQCANGIDDDGDRRIDTSDPDCM